MHTLLSLNLRQWFSMNVETYFLDSQCSTVKLRCHQLPRPQQLLLAVVVMALLLPHPIADLVKGLVVPCVTLEGHCFWVCSLSCLHCHVSSATACLLASALCMCSMGRAFSHFMPCACCLLTQL